LACGVALFEKAKELSAGRVERALLIFGPVGDERSTFVVEDREHDLVCRPAKPRSTGVDEIGKHGRRLWQPVAFEKRERVIGGAWASRQVEVFGRAIPVPSRWDMSED
jgi:hypothetical protein